MEAKEYNKVTPCNKPYVSNLLGKNTEWQMLLNGKRDKGLEKGRAFTGSLEHAH